MKLNFQLTKISKRNITSAAYERIEQAKNATRVQLNGTFSIFQQNRTTGTSSSADVNKSSSDNVLLREAEEKEIQEALDSIQKANSKQHSPPPISIPEPQIPSPTTPSLEERLHARQQALKAGYANRYAGKPSKSGKRTKWENKEKNYFLDKWCKYLKNPPTVAKTLTAKITDFLIKVEAVDKPKAELFYKWQKHFNEHGK